jgi:hypothetical protein
MGNPTERFERKVESNDSSASFAEPHVGLHHAIDDRLAVLVLIDLEEGRVTGRLDEVPFRIDVEEARHLGTAEDEIGIEAGAAVLQRRAVDAVHLAHCVADETRGAVERGRRE